jgi:hypothetical protein
MTPQQANRIQNAANRTRQTIYVVGSRANGTAHAGSDWDYVLTGSKDQRQSAKSSLPGWMSEDNAAQNNLGHGYTNTGRGIDIFHNYSPHDARGGYVALDTTRPYVEFVPNVPVVGLPGRGPVNPAFIAAHAIGNPNTGLQYVNSRRGAQGEAFDIPST